MTVLNARQYTGDGKKGEKKAFKVISDSEC